MIIMSLIKPKFAQAANVLRHVSSRNAFNLLKVCVTQNHVWVNYRPFVPHPQAAYHRVLICRLQNYSQPFKTQYLSAVLILWTTKTVVVVVVVEYSLTSHQTHYRSYWGQFYGSDDPTNSVKHWRILVVVRTPGKGANPSRPIPLQGKVK